MASNGLTLEDIKGDLLYEVRADEGVAVEEALHDACVREVVIHRAELVLHALEARVHREPHSYQYTIGHTREASNGFDICVK